MYQTQIFNLLARYSDDSVSNPVADLVLHHGCALRISDAAQDELRHLLDVLTSTSVKVYESADILHMDFPGQNITINAMKQLTLNGVDMPCICEACGDLVSFVSSGEVITILPVKLLEGFK